MKATEANAKIAAKMTERAVAALAETLDHLRHHGQQLARLETKMKEMAAPPPSPGLLPHPSSPHLPTPRPVHLLPITAAYIAGVAFGAFIVSW